MSSIIASTLPPAVAPAADTVTNASGSGARGSSGSSLTSNAQATLNSQSAAFVTLSAEGRSRAASGGEGRRVDASFEKQEAEAKPRQNGEAAEDGRGNPALVDVAA